MITANELKLQIQHLFPNPNSVDYKKIITAWNTHFKGNSNHEVRFQQGHPPELDDLVALGILNTFWGSHNFEVTDFGDRVFEPLNQDWDETLRSQPFAIPGLGITL